MKKFNNFLLERLNIKQQKFLDKIISYLHNNLNFDIFLYNDEFIVNKKDGEKLIGKLYLTDNNRAVRFNFKGNNIDSIDIWNFFKFKFKNSEKLYNKPSYTIMVDNSITQYLGLLVDFINGHISVNEDVDNIEFKEADEEDVKFKNLKLSNVVLNQNLDIFTTMEMFVKQVAYKISNSLVITGGAGLGKTSTVLETLKEIGKKPNIDYITFGGDITTAGLYETLFIYRDKLIVFDDCDDVFKEKASVNILKVALDTYKIRKISRILKTNFDSEGMTDAEIQAEYEKTGKLPKTFEFTGQIIFISNINGKDMDPAVISRSIHVDIDLNREEVLNRMRQIMEKLYPLISMKVKEETLEFLDYMVSNFKTKFDLNIRTLIHSINIRVSNDFMINFDGEKVPAWQMLIKQYLVEK